MHMTGGFCMLTSGLCPLCSKNTRAITRVFIFSKFMRIYTFPKKIDYSGISMS